jgi:hypothetical protein
VIFSDPEVSAFIRTHFVAAWESVRPVPVVEIDFGNGHKLKRTLNGNIATYICAPDGRVLDIIPGLVEAKAYLRELQYALNLYRAAEHDLERVVLDFHKSNLKEATRYEMGVPDYAKARIERPMKKAVSLELDLLLEEAEKEEERNYPDTAKRMIERPMRRMTEEEKLLKDDTRLNLVERRPAIHRMLSEKLLKPSDLTKRLYKDVLHCDLDDPYLGLATKAFGGGGY